MVALAVWGMDQEHLPIEETLEKKRNDQKSMKHSVHNFPKFSDLNT